MSASWRKGFDPSLLIQRIDETIKVDDAGNLTFTGFEHFEHEAVLHNILSFPDDIPETEAHRIVSSALSAAARNPPITSKSILGHVNRLLNEYNRRPDEPYILLTTVSLNREVSLPTTRPRETTITFHNSPKPRFTESRGILEEQALRRLDYNSPLHYTFVRVFTRAKSPFAAANKALDGLDLIRGILNWFENQRHPIRLSQGLIRPVNEILLGPIHTLHRPSGELATDTWWYEPNFRALHTTYSPRLNHLALAKFLRDIRERIHLHPYRSIIEDSIIRYCRALDEYDLASAFQKLWVVLEILTGKPRSYETTVDRASFVYKEYLYRRQILNHLKSFRNARVHEDASSELVETYLYQLKNYVESLLGFHLIRGKKLGSYESAMDFLDLPPEEEKLQYALHLYSEAIDFRTN
jgi:hypothetical protein